jgi:hypothetical protein
MAAAWQRNDQQERIGWQQFVQPVTPAIAGGQKQPVATRSSSSSSTAGHHCCRCNMCSAAVFDTTLSQLPVGFGDYNDLSHDAVRCCACIVGACSQQGVQPVVINALMLLCTRLLSLRTKLSSCHSTSSRLLSQ